MLKSGTGEALLQLGGSKFASASQFKGKWMVGLREFYQKEGSGWMPGKKGISLSMDQFNVLSANAQVRIICAFLQPVCPCCPCWRVAFNLGSATCTLFAAAIVAAAPEGLHDLSEEEVHDLVSRNELLVPSATT